jgi:hypothetical protein
MPSSSRDAVTPRSGSYSRYAESSFNTAEEERKLVDDFFTVYRQNTHCGKDLNMTRGEMCQHFETTD